MELGVDCPRGALLDDADLRDVNLVGRDLTGSVVNRRWLRLFIWSAL